MISGRQRAQENLDAFARWARGREAAGDWSLYVRSGVLNRSEIAMECGFARSVLLQNPAVRSALAALEERLRLEGVLPLGTDKKPAPSEIEQQRPDRRDRRIDSLESRLAEIRAENAALREQVRRLEAICGDLLPTGRRLHPGRLGGEE